MTVERSIDELPNEVYIPLGRRGMEGIPLKLCTYACDGDELKLVSVTTEPEEITNHGLEPVLEDWLVECTKCHRLFTIRCKIRYLDGKRVDTMVSILDDHGNDLGWLGNY